MSIRHAVLITLVLSSLSVSAQRVPDHIRAAKRVARDAGWALTDTALLRTTDDGTTWRTVTPEGVEPNAIRGASFPTESAAYLAVIQSTPLGDPVSLHVVASRDGGRTWSASRIPMNASDAADLGGFVSVEFIDGENGWLLASLSSTANSSRGVLFRTTDGGATWTELNRPPIAGTLRFADETTGWLLGGPGQQDLFVTRDGGATWQRDPLTLAVRDVHFKTLSIDDARHATLIAEDFGPASRTFAFKTTDAGRTWKEQQRPEASAMLPDAITEAVDDATGEQGWVLSTRGHCAGFKTDCRQETRLFSAAREISPMIARSVASNSSGTVGTIYNHPGFDACVAPTPSFMSTWWTYSPYYAIGIYIGGPLQACSQPNMPDSGWTKTISDQGWSLIPIWVGPQAVGWNSGTGTIGVGTDAYQQGQTQAVNAAAAANGYGLDRTIVYYDLERYDAPTQTARTNVKSFIRGWVDGLHARGFKAGVYVHIHNAVDDLAALWGNASAPDDVWILKAFLTRPTGTVSVYGLADGSTSFPDSYWPNDRRLRQYYIDQSGTTDDETYGGTAKLATDSDWLDAPLVDDVGAKFNVGDSVHAITGLNVRSSAAGSVVTSVTAGTVGITQEAPVVATLSGVAYRWWHVRWSNNADGWSFEGGMDPDNSTPVCYSLSTSTSPANGGSISKSGANCGSGYSSGTQISVSASPNSGYTFNNWTGSGGSFANNAQTSTTFTITGNAQITANFTATPQVGTISAKATLDGSAWSGNINLSVNGPQFVGIGQVPQSVGNVATGSYTMTYNSGGPGGTMNGITPSATQTLGANGTITFTVNFVSVSNPQPSITSISPATVTAGGPAFTLTVNGGGFIPASVVYWKGNPRSTTYVSATRVTTSISASDIAAAGSAQVSVVNPAPGGGVSGAWTLQIQSPPSGPSTRYDFNADTHADVLWRNSTTGTNYLYFMNGMTKSGEATINVVTEPGWKIVGKGDFNGDGRCDILWRDELNGVNYIYLMNGASKIDEGTISVAELQWKVAGVGDFNNDGKEDILWRNTSTNQNWIYFMNGKTIQSQGSIGTADAQWQVAGVGDFNNDHYADVLWSNAQTGDVYIYFMNGLNRISEGVVRRVDLAWKITGVGDLNADGRDDILWRNVNDGRLYAYLLNGLSVTSEGVVSQSDSAWYVAAVGDYDGDGRADVFWRNDTNGYNYVYLMNGLSIVSQGVLNIASSDWKVQ